MRSLSFFCLCLLCVLSLAWVLPQLYAAALIRPLDKTHVFFSPALKQFIYTEQIYGYDAQAAALSDGHHADIVYRDESGRYYDRLAFEAALPFIYFRNMEMRGLLPVRVDGQEFQRVDIERSRRVMELPARLLDGKHPRHSCLPLLESRPGQAALLYPADRFVLTPTEMLFVNADSNAPDPDLTEIFTAALKAAGFRFPVRHVGGNFTTFKPYEGGVYLVDASGALFRVLRRKGRPEVDAVPLPPGVEPRHVLVSENRERLWGGLLLADSGTLYLMKETADGAVPGLIPLELPGYDPDSMDCKLLFDPLYLTVTISHETHIKAFVFDLPAGDSPAVGQLLRARHVFSHHMARAGLSPAHYVADALFPFRIEFVREKSAFRRPEIVPSGHWLLLALPFSLLLAGIHGVRLLRRGTLSAVHLTELALILGTGIFGYIPLLLLREEKPRFFRETTGRMV